jgi:hypothetical protein
LFRCALGKGTHLWCALHGLVLVSLSAFGVGCPFWKLCVADSLCLL